MLKRLSLIAVFLVGVTGSATPVTGQAKPTAAVRSIDSYVRTVDLHRKKQRTPNLIFADTSGVEDEQETWQRFASEKALERHRERSETYSIAYNWLKAGKVVASNFTLFSPSGDWVKYNFHYFRPDGSLALVESDYRTFMGDFRVVRKRYFDNTGKQISSSVRILDLKTNKSKKAPDGVMGDDPEDADLYLTTAKLPFAGLVPGK